MAAWHYDLFLIETKSVDVGALTSRLNRDLPPLKSPSPKLLLWGDAEGDRIDFWTDHEPLQLLARFDLRTPSDSFRRLVLDLSAQFSLRLLNGDDVEIAAQESALLGDLHASAAHAAAMNPGDNDEQQDEDDANAE
jgi:hypothetical protein